VNPRLKTFVINVLRAASRKWEARDKAKIRGRVLAKDHLEIDAGRSKYLYPCAVCGKLCREISGKKPKEFQMDHLEPVEPTNGYKSGLELDLNEHVERMFCDDDGWQRLCISCHQEKSNKENEERRVYKKGKKNERKDI
jgi:hypothetical protein